MRLVFKKRLLMGIGFLRRVVHRLAVSAKTARDLQTELRPIRVKRLNRRRPLSSSTARFSGLNAPSDTEELATILDSLRHSGAVALKVNIVCYEDAGWILGRIADRLSDELRACGVSVTQSRTPQEGFDVVHHIPFHPVARRSGTATESMMVTHLDTPSKLSRVRRLAEVGVIPIAMSRQTVDLVNKGLSAESKETAVCALLPSFIDRHPRLRVGVFYRLYSDGRKREQVLGACLRELGLGNFELFIMGSGWEPEISRFRREGLAVSYASDFDSTTYLAWLDHVDVVVVTGRDEGAVSFLDALAVGNRVIVSRIGYHADYEHELVVYANSVRDFVNALRVELLRRQTAYDLVAGANWRRYGLEHLILWSRAGELEYAHRAAKES
jgi:hypothetical protein